MTERFLGASAKGERREKCGIGGGRNFEVFGSDKEKTVRSELVTEKKPTTLPLRLRPERDSRKKGTERPHFVVRLAAI